MIFQKFFPGPARQPDWGRDQPPKRPDPVRQPEQRGQHQPAEGEEVRSAPQRHRGDVVDAHLPVVPQEGEGEQRRRRAQPEQQVQDKGQPGQPQGAAQGAHPVVKEAQGGAQLKALGKDRRLTDGVYVHAQRSSREKNPPRLPPSSS